MSALPRLCPGGTVVCIASGPSLTTDDVEYVRGKATVIAVNDAVLWASDPPVNKWKDYRAESTWADVIFSVDQNWWGDHYQAVRAVSGLRARVDPSHDKPLSGTGPKYCDGCRRRKVNDKPCWCNGIVTLKNAGYEGISLEPDTICTAHNSGGAAINVAVQLGATRVLLLGYDMGIDERGRRHFYDTEAMMVNSPFDRFRTLIATMAEPLKAAGIEVVNCSRKTRLECFPRMALREAL